MSLFIQAKTSSILWFQLPKFEDLWLFFIINDSYLNILSQSVEEKHKQFEDVTWNILQLLLSSDII